MTSFLGAGVKKANYIAALPRKSLIINGAGESAFVKGRVAQIIFCILIERVAMDFV
jgi:hypothetical protein